MSYPEHGQGGAFQLLPIDKMDILPNLRTDLILREKR